MLLAAVLLASLFAVSFSGCSLFKNLTPEEVKANLESAGYTVTVMTGEEYADSDQNTYILLASELETYMYAVKDNDVIHLFFFIDTDTASHNYDFMIAPDGLLGGQNNSVVYFGTRQARKDAKV